MLTINDMTKNHKLLLNLKYCDKVHLLQFFKNHLFQYLSCVPIVVFLSCFLLNAQEIPSALWLRHTCGYTNGINLLGGDVWGNSVCVDNIGNSYNSGSFNGYWFVMDTIIEMNNNRFYINKYNSKGERIWTAKAKGTTINSIMTSSRMKCDDLGNIYVCGTFSADDSVFMAPNWYPVGSGYIAKYDSNGNNLWCRFIPKSGTSSISFNDMALANGYIYICGIMSFGSQTFGEFSFLSTTSQNGIVAKLDFNGNILAARQLDTGSVNEIHGIEVSPLTNDVFIVGQYISTDLTVDNQIVSYTPNAQNSFIIKLDESLKMLWAKKCNTFLHANQTVGSSITCLKRIEIDKYDNIYIAANGNGDSTVIGSLSFNHRISPNSSYAQDIFIAKLNSNGQDIWLRHGGSDGMDELNDIVVDQWGNSILSVYSSQQSKSGLIFGKDTIKQWHGGLVKYDINGNLLYTLKLQEARSLKALAMSNDSVFYGTGNGFNPGLPYANLSINQCEDTVHGYYKPPFNMVMVKFIDNTGDFTSYVKSSDFQTTLNLYPHPVQNILYLPLIDNSHDSYIIYDIFGCELLHDKFEEKSIINVSHLSAGTYFLKVFNSQKLVSLTSKFIKI